MSLEPMPFIDLFIRKAQIDGKCATAKNGEQEGKEGFHVPVVKRFRDPNGTLDFEFGAAALMILT